jgi:hypothetical protein
LLEDFAARLLGLGHGVKTRIIAGLSVRAKCSRANLNFRGERGSNGANG